MFTKLELKLTSVEMIRGIRKIVDKMMLTPEQIEQVMSTLEEEMKLGLSNDERNRTKTSLQMENTYVQSLMDGTESGRFLALDLGGTNFRVLLCEMVAGKCVNVDMKYYTVPNNKLYGPSRGVYDFLATCIADFLDERNLKEHCFTLGFTFSFPMIQQGLNKGILVTWTKTFKCTDGVGDDAVKGLKDAISRRGDLKVDIIAVLNDTTGTLMAGAYLDHRCKIGLIMGTGCNAAYVERLAKVEKWDGDRNGPQTVVIDTEWGAFGDNGSLDFLKTDVDYEVDKHSNHIGSFTFEKLFSGHYAGELVRLLLQKLTHEGLIFDGKGSIKLFTRNSIQTSHVTNIDNDTNESSATKSFLKELELESYISDDTLTIIRYVCAVISLRASQLVGCCLSVLLRHIQEPEVTIAIDGSQYENHIILQKNMQQIIDALVPETKTNLILAKDGSGRGAAFVAAVAYRRSIELSR